MKRSGLLLLVALLVSSCHTNKNFTQTFEREDDPNQKLVLSSKTGLVPTNGFLLNAFFKVFGGGELEGTYEQKTQTGTVKGTFVAGKEGEKQWIRFKPGEGATDKTEWKVQVKLGGMLADGDKIWALKKMSADAKAVSSFQIGGN